MLRLENEGLCVALHEPQDGFYRGTRFDRSGVFDSVAYNGMELADRWFSRYDPYMHDAVCGPAEEFTQIGFEQAAQGETFLKIGVGLLNRPDDAPYDRFRLYEIADPGEWTVKSDKDVAVFRHRLSGYCEYVKEIVLTGPDTMEIRHSLESLGASLHGEVYNHNFWTLGRLATGPLRYLDFPFKPDGKWRAEYDNVALTASGIRFARLLAEGESVYMGDLHEAGAEGSPYEMSVREGSVGVQISGDVPVTHTVFWANHRVACLEPYNSFTAPFRWTVRYRFISYI